MKFLKLAMAAMVLVMAFAVVGCAKKEAPATPATPAAPEAPK